MKFSHVGWFDGFTKVLLQAGTMFATGIGPPPDPVLKGAPGEDARSASNSSVIECFPASIDGRCSNSSGKSDCSGSESSARYFCVTLREVSTGR